MQAPPEVGGYQPPPEPGQCPVTFSPTYKAPLPSCDHLRCDAVKNTCYRPGSYGKRYNPKTYICKKRTYPYPGPRKRFKHKVQKMFKSIKGFFKKGVKKVKKGVKKIKKKFKRKWQNFHHMWNKWCAIAKSDWDRFQDLMKCKVQDWKDKWEYYHDLCITRKQLWDDAQREFHRLWHIQKKVRKAEYEARKKQCGITEKDYDDTPEYRQDCNEFGVSPVEQFYDPTLKYNPTQYAQNCHAKDEEFYKDHPEERPR